MPRYGHYHKLHFTFLMTHPLAPTSMYHSESVLISISGKRFLAVFLTLVVAFGLQVLPRTLSTPLKTG